MTDSPQLETPEQALARARAWFEDLVENHPDEARVILGRPTGPIGWTEGEERARAFVGMLDTAIDVHCVHRCDHVPGPGTALLRCGVYFCRRDECRERFADLEPRDDGLCDLCGRPAPRLIALQYPVPPDGWPTVMARLCEDCVAFYQSLLATPSQN
jgi:hypothetical protein